MHDLSERITQLLAQAYIEEKADSEYQDNFANEGSRKTQYIVDDLLYRQSRGQFRLEEVGYLCIGGADGSEVEHIMTETGIKKAVMIEISDDAVKRAEAKASTLAEMGKEFVIIHGDATVQLDSALSVAEKWYERGNVVGLVCSAQGVLHELPMRSKGFELNIFLGQLFRFSDWSVSAFYSREPCTPDGWPDDVSIRIPTLKGEELVRMAKYVRDRLRMSGEPQALGTGWVNLPAPLAVETLHKLIRGGSIRRIGYELGEQLTSFDALQAKDSLQAYVDGMRVSVERVTTAGFKKALEEYKVEYMGQGSKSLPVPQTHSEIIAFASRQPSRLPLSSELIEETELDRTETELPTKPVQFDNPFKGAVEDSDIKEWLLQFDSSERPLVARLLSEFNYITMTELTTLSKQLFAELEKQLGSDIHKAKYVPLGGVGKSGGMIAYLFKNSNSIPQSQFISLGEVADLDMAGEVIVFLDDLLASGHQARYEIDSFHKDAVNADDCRIVVGSLVSCAAGEDLLTERRTLSVCSAIRITRSDEPLSQNSRIFPLASEREKLRKVLIKYGERLVPQGPLGYGNAGLLLGFEHAIPDNSLPIFWASTDDWKPLIHRGRAARLGY